jgi:hypothetical protein
MRLPTVLALILTVLASTASAQENKQRPWERSPVPGLGDLAWNRMLEHADDEDLCDSMELMSRVLLLKVGRALDEKLRAESIFCANNPKKNGKFNADGLKWQIAIYILMEMNDQKDEELKVLRAFKEETEKRLRVLEAHQTPGK